MTQPSPTRLLPLVTLSWNAFPRFVKCFLAVFALSLALALACPAAAREDIRIGLQLEPPMLDPTANVEEPQILKLGLRAHEEKVRLIFHVRP